MIYTSIVNHLVKQSKDNWRRCCVYNIEHTNHHVIIDRSRAEHAVDSVPKLTERESKIFQKEVIQKNAHPVVRVSAMNKE